MFLVTRYHGQHNDATDRTSLKYHRFVIRTLCERNMGSMSQQSASQVVGIECSISIFGDNIVK